MSEIFDSMLSAYQIRTSDDKRNAVYEVMQQVILAGLYRGGFFKEAAFYGGTCLRIFHGLKRFSEDMDFSLLKKDPEFSLEKYFPAIIEECRSLGREVSITKCTHLHSGNGRIGSRDATGMISNGMSGTGSRWTSGIFRPGPRSSMALT